MKHVVTRPFILSAYTRLGATYARQPLLQPAKLPLLCGLIVAILTFFWAPGGGSLFVIGALSVFGCLGWAILRCATRLGAFLQDYVNNR